jgi:tripartite-type tricarboxylate transporter receptor subunit TctC
MSTNRRNFLASSVALLGFTLVGTSAMAQSAAPSFPTKPITIVVPFGAGTTTDQVARFLSPYLAAELKQPVIIDNKAGASGSIGMQFAARQAADGYTFVLGTNTTHAANVSLFNQLPYDPVKDFTPISNLIIGGVVLVVAADHPAKNVQELVAMMKKNPGRMTFGAGNSSSRAGGEVMRERAGVDILHIPYKTLPVALTDLIGGQIDMVFGDAPAVMPLVESGKLRALGVSTGKRIAKYANIPTIAEQGVEGYEVTGWIAAFGLNGTPPDIINRLNRAIVHAMKTDEAERQFGSQGWTPVPGTPEALKQFQLEEIDRWARLVKAAGIQPT